jgi:hypothetical protein
MSALKQVGSGSMLHWGRKEAAGDEATEEAVVAMRSHPTQAPRATRALVYPVAEDQVEASEAGSDYEEEEEEAAEQRRLRVAAETQAALEAEETRVRLEAVARAEAAAVMAAQTERLAAEEAQREAAAAAERAAEEAVARAEAAAVMAAQTERLAAEEAQREAAVAAERAAEEAVARAEAAARVKEAAVAEGSGARVRAPVKPAGVGFGRVASQSRLAKFAFGEEPA